MVLMTASVISKAYQDSSSWQLPMLRSKKTALWEMRKATRMCRGWRALIVCRRRHRSHSFQVQGRAWKEKFSWHSRSLFHKILKRKILMAWLSTNPSWWVWRSQKPGSHGGRTSWYFQMLLRCSIQKPISQTLISKRFHDQRLAPSAQNPDWLDHAPVQALKFQYHARPPWPERQPSASSANRKATNSSKSLTATSTARRKRESRNEESPTSATWCPYLNPEASSCQAKD